MMMEQILDHLFAKMNVVQERMEANIKEMKVEIKTNNKKCEVLQGIFVSWMDIHQARTETIQEKIISKMDAHQESMEATMNAWRKEMTPCQEATEACL
jgi:hypothetical protein